MALILIVHDDDVLREVIKRFLSHANHAVIEAANGVEGMRKFEAERPDVIITDIFMPEKDGIELILAVRAAGGPQRVVAVSGDPHYLAVAREFGADAVITSPFERSDFIETVTHLLTDERRAAKRKPVLWTGRLEADGQLLDCILLNISSGGAMLQVSTPVAAQTVTLVLDRFGSFGATVRWRQADKLGISFADAPDEIAQAFARALPIAGSSTPSASRPVTK